MAKKQTVVKHEHNWEVYYAPLKDDLMHSAVYAECTDEKCHKTIDRSEIVQILNTFYK